MFRNTEDPCTNKKETTQSLPCSLYDKGTQKSNYEKV